MMTEIFQEKAGAIKSIVKAARVVNLLTSAGTPLSLAHISSEMNMSKSTLHGIISTLVDVKFLVQEQDTGRYWLGTRLFEIGSAIFSQWNVRNVAYPFIQRIVAEVEETVHMGILDDYEVLYINKLEASNSIRIVTDIGSRIPSHCTGLGKALLSGLSSFELLCMVKAKGQQKYTESTITSHEKLWQELELVRERGYALDEQEFAEGLRCIAVPIFDHAGSIIAALSISGPVSRMRGDKLEHHRSSLQKATAEISAQMGYDNKKRVFKVSIPDMGKTFHCRSDEYLYYALRKAHILTRRGCAGGGCGICKVYIQSGQVVCDKMSSEHVKSADAARGMVLACRAKPISDLVLRISETN